MTDKIQKNQLENLHQAIEALTNGNYQLELPTGDDKLAPIYHALQQLADHMRLQAREQQFHNQFNDWVNAGLLLEDVLEKVFEGLGDFIPYDRIGISVIDADENIVRSIWAKTHLPDLILDVGYTAPLHGSSLETIIQTGRPRIINNLGSYYEQKPKSESTKLILDEGIQSSLTCPLIANGVPVGFIFFSSAKPDTYANAHIEVFQRIASQLSVVVERGSMISELKEQNRELLRLNKMKNTFLGMASHDLRHPMSNIQLAIGLLLDMSIQPSPEERSVLENVQHQIDQIMDLLNKLLDVTAIESGKLELQRQPIDLKEMLSLVDIDYAERATIKNSVIQLGKLPEGQISADPQRLRQILDNLISNALKFSPAGSQIKIWADQEDHFWRISVQDQGPGLTAEDREKLFVDFARLSARPTGGETSTGLGLAITRRMVEAHGGQIGVYPAPEGGSIFWFTLPKLKTGDRS